MTKKAISTITNFVKSHPRPLILSGITLVFLSLFFINYSLTHAEDSIILTINGGPTNNGKTITIDKDDCTTFTLDTTTTTDNELGYSLKAYTKASSTSITIKKQDNTELSTNPNNPVEIIKTNIVSTRDKQTTTYQACAEENISDGGKTAEVAYIINENQPIPMQTFTSSDCQSLPIYNKTNPDPASTITMIDTRNDQWYDVRRLQDGKCWMIDNLKLELKNDMTLTPEDTNVATNTTVYFTQDGTKNGTALTGLTKNFTTSGHLTRSGTDSTTSPNQDAWRQADPSNVELCLNNSGYSGIADITYNVNSKSKCGYLYNVYTATAGTAPQSKTSGVAESSICPTGWSLPRGYNSDAAQNDFAVLNGYMAGDDAPSQAYSYNSKYYKNWEPAGSFRGSLSGMYSSSESDTFNLQGTKIYMWTSSMYSDIYAHLLYTHYGSYVYPGNDYYKIHQRYIGMAVRCLVN